MGLGNFDLILKSWNLLCQVLDISLCFFLSFMQGTPGYELVCLWGLGVQSNPLNVTLEHTELALEKMLEI